MTKYVNDLAKDIMWAIKEQKVCHAKLEDKQNFEMTQEKLKNVIQKRLLNLFEELNPPVD